MGRYRDKLRSKGGIGLIFVVLIAAIAVVCVSIFILAYQQHLKNSRRLFDEVTVDTAERVARETYILDIKSGGITYYYNDVHRTVTDASTYKGKVGIAGYGRSYESENKNGETGAIGIPNKGENGGAQILAVSVESDGSVHSRWQGQYLTGYDYELMTPAERDRLTIYQLRQIDANLIYESGKSDAENEGDPEGVESTEESSGSASETEAETNDGDETHRSSETNDKQV